MVFWKAIHDYFNLDDGWQAILNVLNVAEIIVWSQAIGRSSRLEVFCKKDVLRRFTKFTGKHLRQSLFFNKVATLINLHFY